MQAILAGWGMLSSVVAWLAGATFWWTIAGVLLGSVIPFALIVILPTNKQLLSPALDRRSAHAGQLLARWGALHAVRSGLSCAALLLFLFFEVSMRCECLRMLPTQGEQRRIPRKRRDQDARPAAGRALARDCRIH